jgi:LPS O-antigen subunit length determinant protein (WzzB/FepE family)
MENKDLNLNNERDNLFHFIWQNKKPLLIFAGAAFVISVIISFLITPLYLSSAIVFPAASGNVSFSEQRNVKAAAMDFGEEEQAEQLVQILQSARIKERIVKKYNLFEHYNIDPKESNRNYKLTQEYNDHISFTRTRYGSIQIDVLDKDPKQAAKIANDIVDLIDIVKNEMINERTKPAFEINKRKLIQLKNEMDSISNVMTDLSSKGVAPLKMRSNLIPALVDSKNPEEKAEIQRKIDVNIKYGPIYDALEIRIEEMIVKMEEFRVSYEQAESDANSNFTHKFIVEKAEVADRKEKPKRMIIVLVSVVSGFIFGVFFLLIKQRIQELKLSA